MPMKDGVKVHSHAWIGVHGDDWTPMLMNRAWLPWLFSMSKIALWSDNCVEMIGNLENFLPAVYSARDKNNKKKRIIINEWPHV